MLAGLKNYPTMKYVGLPWLREVPEHWEVFRLGQIGRLSKGSGGSREDDTSTGVPCVRYGDLYTTHRFFIRKSRSFVGRDRAKDYTGIQYGDVLFAGSGETIDDIGKSAVNLMTSEACCGGDVILFRSARDVDARFMGYATDCRPAAAQKASMGRGITVKHIYADQLKYMAIPLPPVPEQVTIVRFLDHMDRRIRRYIHAKKRLIKLLEEQKQVIIERAVTRGLDPNVRLKPSGVEWLGDVPEHWEVNRLGRLIDLVTGFPFTSGGFTQAAEDVRLLRGVNISPGRIRWADVVRWPQSEREDYSAFELQAGDIVLGMDRPVIQSGTRVATIGESDVPALLLQRVARIRPKRELRSDFLMLLVAGKSFADYLAPIFTGISVPHLSPEQIKSFRFALPTLEEQREIVQSAMAATTKIGTAIVSAEREISLLREYRTRLIADVVTGKLDVREAAARLPEVTEDVEPIEEAEALAETGEDTADDMDAAPEDAEA